VQIAYFADEKEEAQLLDEELARLASQDVAKGDMTILSPLSIERSCVRLTKAYMKRHVRPLDNNSARTWPSSDITFSTVADFKGLENRFILLVDIASLDASEHDQNILYVALSRARAGLWIAVDKRMGARLDQITRGNMEHLQADRPDSSHAFQGAK
jgi:superfamily I DNA and RNA helicase